MSAKERKPICPKCREREIGEFVYCHKCLAEIRNQLDQIPGLYVLAHDCLQPGKGGHGSSSGERTIGVNVDALEYVAGIEILRKLHEWEDYVRETKRAEGYPIALRHDPSGPILNRILTCVEFLLVHYNWIKSEEVRLAVFARDIHELHFKGLTATRQTLTPMRSIRCPADHREGLCGSWLEVDASDMERKIVCKRCHTNWSTMRLVMVALASPDTSIWLDAESIAQFKNLTVRQVRTFARSNKGKIPKRGLLYELTAFLREFEIQETTKREKAK